MSNQVYANETTKYSSIVNLTSVSGSIGSAFTPALPWTYNYYNNNGITTIVFNLTAAITQLNASELITSTLPLGARPSRTLDFPASVIRNGNVEVGRVQILADGTLKIFGVGNFTSATVCGVPPSCWSYSSV